MSRTISRRQLATAFAAAVPAAAQQASTPATELEKAMETMRANSQKLAAITVPIDTEPAFVFKP